jgi:hypothetical protein
MWSAAPLLAAGGFLLLWCVRDFYVEGKGTLAPWSPPQHLVVSGLYRLSRNPMYVAVLLILSGWATGFRSRALTIYAVCVAIAFHVRLSSARNPGLRDDMATSGSAIERACRGGLAGVERGAPSKARRAQFVYLLRRMISF